MNVPQKTGQKVEASAVGVNERNGDVSPTIRLASVGRVLRK